MGTAAQRLRAIDLHKMGFSDRKIAAVLAVSKTTVQRWRRGVPQEEPARDGVDRTFDYDEAIRLLQYPFWNQTRVAFKMGVTRNAISKMIKRMLESTVEEGGQI